MPLAPTSRASDFVSPSSAVFDAAYTVCPAFPRIATALDMFTMRPHFSRSIPRIAAWAHRNAPLTLVSITWS